MKSEATIKEQLADARNVMANSKDPIEARLAQTVEYTLCWALGDRFALQAEVNKIGDCLREELAAMKPE